MVSLGASRARIWVALTIVYVVWGSTYLGIDLAVRTIPPFLMAAVRFLIAGGLLYAWATRRGDRADRPTARHWLSAFLIAAPMLAVGNAASIARMVRSSMVAVRREEYVKVARAKGLHEAVVVRRHMLKNALIPVITLIGIVAGYLLGGSIVVEQVFAIPGVGRLGLQAITQRDYPVLQAVVLMVTGLFVLVNLVVDVIYVLLDPRISYIKR